MAGIGIGMGVGFGRGATAAKAPNQAGIDRQFRTLSDGNLIDSIASRDATVLYPVSSFDGVDGYVETSFVPTENSDVVFKYKHIEDTVGIKVLFGSRNVDLRWFVYVNGDQLSIAYGDVASGVGKTLSIGETVEIRVFTNGNDMDIEVNGAPFTGVTKTTSGTFLPAYIGALNLNGSDSVNINALIWDIDIDGIQIPLPHLPYAFEPNGSGGYNTISTTVTGGVSEDYNVDGSRWMQHTAGAVARNPEQYTTANVISVGNETNSLNGIISAGTTNSVSSDSVVGSYSALLTSPDGINDRSIISISLVVGKIYDITIWAKRGQGTSQQFRNWVGFSDFVNTPITSTEWTEYKFTLTASSTTGSILTWATLAAGNVGDSVYIDGLSIKLATPDYIPNKPNGEPAFPIIVGDTYISKTNFLNVTPCLIRLFTIGDTDPEYTFFDKRDVTTYPQSVRDDIWFNILDPGLFKVPEEMSQRWNYDNILIAKQDKWWIRLINNQYKDFIFYNTALAGQDKTDMIKYVRVSP